MENCRTAQINALHENCYVVSAIVRDITAPNACHASTVLLLMAQTNPENTAYLDVMGDPQQDTWSVQIHIGLQEATFKIDANAEMMAISEKLYKRLRSSILQKPSKIKGPGQHPLQVVGQFHEVLHHGQNSSLQNIFVIEDLKSNLLSLPAITALNLAVRLDNAYTFLVQD